MKKQTVVLEVTTEDDCNDPMRWDWWSFDGAVDVNVIGASPAIDAYSIDLGHWVYVARSDGGVM